VTARPLTTSHLPLLTLLLLLPRDRLLAGLVLGGAYLIRPEALLIAGALAAVFAWRERRLPVGLPGGVVLWVVPYVLFLHHETGAWALTGKTGFLDTAVASYQGAAYLGDVLTRAGALLAVLPRLLGWPLLLTAAVGLVARPRLGYWALAALLPLPLFDFAMADRYWLPYLPWLLLAAGLGAPVWLGWARRWRRPVVPVAWLAV
jgi:hypothetical protein